MRNLTATEHERLAARHIDPTGWWAHAQSHFGDAVAEAVLVAQLAAADAVIVELGEAYVPYAARVE